MGNSPTQWVLRPMILAMSTLPIKAIHGSRNSVLGLGYRQFSSFTVCVVTKGCGIRMGSSKLSAAPVLLSTPIAMMGAVGRKMTLLILLGRSTQYLAIQSSSLPIAWVGWLLENI